VRIFTDYAAGATATRPQLIAAWTFSDPGTALAARRIDLLGHSVAELEMTRPV